MIEETLIYRKLTMIGQDLSILERFATMSEADYLADPINEAAVERYLERIIGRMIDINYHLLTEAGEAPPRDFYTSFVQLAKHQILDAGFANSIADVAGLRNRIAHEYDEVDAKIIYASMNQALIDIPKYMQAITRYLDKIAD